MLEIQPALLLSECALLGDNYSAPECGLQLPAEDGLTEQGDRAARRHATDVRSRSECRLCERLLLCRQQLIEIQEHFAARLCERADRPDGHTELLWSRADHATDDVRDLRLREWRLALRRAPLEHQGDRVT